MHVPHFPQELDYSCLAACVRMVLAYYGRQYTESELRSLLKTRPGGTSPVNAMLHLPSLGFSAFLPDASLPYLRQQAGSSVPCITHVWTPPLPHWRIEAIHALVVADVIRDAVIANDPIQTSGPTAIPLAPFVEAWAATGYTTLVIQPIR